jgi:ferrous iron transport protein A
VSKFAALLNASQLVPNQSAIITALPESPFSQRLAEMGCVPGTPIKLLYTAPSGDPMAFDIEGYILALRKNEAAVILVQIENSHQ